MPFRSVPNGRAFVVTQAATAKEMVVCSAPGADSVVVAKSRFHSSIPKEANRRRKVVTSPGYSTYPKTSKKKESPGR